MPDPLTVASLWTRNFGEVSHVKCAPTTSPPPPPRRRTQALPSNPHERNPVQAPKKGLTWT